jgi:hypothetical protein
MFCFGDAHVVSTISPVGLARRLILPCIVGVSKPFMPRSTMKPRMLLASPSSTLAQTTAR